MAATNRPVRTIRQQVLDALFEQLKTARDPSTGEPVFNRVAKEDLDILEAQEFPAAGIEEGEEEVAEDAWPCVRKRLTVFVEFRFHNKRGVDVFDDFNYYLGIVQKTLLYRTESNGLLLADAISEAGSVPRIADRSDNRPGGCLVLSVQYRHVTHDPYVRLP
jgi:hypothetical protein